ncbi:MAG: nucleotidyltransferase domain-containing protein [Chlamydiae bacterium]|nr:MAG: nucleotidyltransferase domain-containing protein [Chlamydiota bacterium]
MMYGQVRRNDKILGFNKMTKKQNILLKEVKDNILSVEPSAEIILYGSRARGDETNDSDWDILVLASKKNEKNLFDSIFDLLYELELKYNAVISLIVKKRGEWNELKLSPFYKNVMKDGLKL